jgi:hypothetical protein
MGVMSALDAERLERCDLPAGTKLHRYACSECVCLAAGVEVADSVSLGHVAYLWHGWELATVRWAGTWTREACGVCGRPPAVDGPQWVGDVIATKLAAEGRPVQFAGVV